MSEKELRYTAQEWFQYLNRGVASLTQKVARIEALLGHVDLQQLPKDLATFMEWSGDQFK